MTLKHGFLSRGIMSLTGVSVTKPLATRCRCFSANTHLSLIFLLCYWLGEDVHSSPTEQTQTFKLIQGTSKGTGKREKGQCGDQGSNRCYLGVRISLYCSFSTRVVAATDMGMTILFISKELSPRRLLIGCCWKIMIGLYQTSNWIQTVSLKVCPKK